MGTGKISLEKAFKGITLGQKYETKIFRLCQFSKTMLWSRPKGFDIFIDIIFHFIRLSVVFFSLQRCICKRSSITTKLEKAVSPCFTQTGMKDMKHMAAENSCWCYQYFLICLPAGQVEKKSLSGDSSAEV